MARQCAVALLHPPQVNGVVHVIARRCHPADAETVISKGVEDIDGLSR
jgi:hypothetical protein